MDSAAHGGRLIRQRECRICRGCSTNPLPDLPRAQADALHTDYNSLVKITLATHNKADMTLPICLTSCEQKRPAKRAGATTSWPRLAKDHVCAFFG